MDLIEKYTSIIEQTHTVHLTENEKEEIFNVLQSSLEEIRKIQSNVLQQNEKMKYSSKHCKTSMT